MLTLVVDVPGLVPRLPYHLPGLLRSIQGHAEACVQINSIYLCARHGSTTSNVL